MTPINLTPFCHTSVNENPYTFSNTGLPLSRERQYFTGYSRFGSNQLFTSLPFVIPVETSIHTPFLILDYRFRGNDISLQTEPAFEAG
jgi:hypothetical protein